MNVRNTLLMALVALPLGLGACGDDTTGDIPNPDVVLGDVSPGDITGPDANPGAVRTLDFETAFGDDQVACYGNARCTVSISFSERRTLKVVYSEDGVPTGGQVVKFALESDDNGIGFLNTLSSVSEPTGVAAVETKAKDSVVGQFVVKAFIDKSDVPPIYFDVVVTPKGQVPLTVLANYSGSRPVGSYNVNLYRQNAAGAPTCDDMQNLLDNETAVQARDNIFLTASAKFPEFDGLEADGEQKYTVFAFSKNDNGAVQAWGCNGEDGVVKWVAPTTVQVEMVDRAPIYAGAYDITTLIDFVSAIPDPYRKWVDYVISFFDTQAGTILRLACDLLTNDEQIETGELNSFCGLLFDVGQDGELVFTVLGGFASDLIDNILVGLAGDSVFGTILQVGGDLADVFKAFEMKATMTFLAEPDAEGRWAAGDAEENWHTVKVKWSLGANCDPISDENCGVRQFSMNAFQQSAVTGKFGASVANFFDLTIDQHPLNLQYGALINYFMEGIVIGLIVSEPNVDSYDELLGYLVGGGSECVLDSTKDCCEIFGERITDAPTTQSIVKAACKTIVDTAPGFLRNALQGLDLGSGETFNIGTKTPCKMLDIDNDMFIDAMGSKDAPCQWNIVLKFSDSAQTTIDSQFWGSHQ